MPEKITLDYDPIANNYDRRYQANQLNNIAACLNRLTSHLKAERILEVGCGTGHWLEQFHPVVPQLFGLDLSFGMLSKAALKGLISQLVCGDAARLPFSAGSFDLVYCVNALHHFSDPAGFICQAAQVLKPDGALAITGMDPHRQRDRWYLYDYFKGTRSLDHSRYPSGGQLLDWMTTSGFQKVEWRVAEHIYHDMVGEEVLDDPFLQKTGTSQLALLSDAEYNEGIHRIHHAIKVNKEEAHFIVDIELCMVTGYR